MKIHYLLNNHPINTEVFVLRELDALRSNGHEVIVINLVPTKAPVHDHGIKIIAPIRKPLKLLIQSFFSFLRGTSVFNKSEHYQQLFNWVGQKSLLKIIASGFLIDNLNRQISASSLKPDHIHSHHLFTTTYAAYQLALHNGINFSVTLHTQSHIYTNSILKKILVKASFLRTISSELLPHFNLLVSNAAKFHLVTNGVNKEEFIFNPPPKSNTASRIIAIGSLYDKKGFDILIQACHLLAGYNLDFECTIYGDGPEHEFLQKLIYDFRLQHRVVLAGAMPNADVMKVLAASDMLIAPSRSPKRSTRDGLPTVIIEAMSLEIPVIATDFAGIPDIVIHKKTGLLIPQEDYKALAASMVDLIFDSRLRQRITRKALSHVQQHYNLKNNLPKLEQLFDNAHELKHEGKSKNVG